MPAFQYYDPNPRQLPRQETTLEKTLGAFADNYTGARRDVQERDQLKEIYSQYQQDGDLLNAAMQANTRPGISPTTRVNTQKTLMDFQKHNTEMQEATNKKIELNQKVKDAEAKDAAAKAEKERKLENNRLINLQLAEKRGLAPEQVAPYEDNPNLLERATRPALEPRINQADRPISEDQLRRIQHVRNQPGYENASSSKKYQLLTDAGVSERNAKSEAEIAVEEAKVKKEDASAEYKVAENIQKRYEPGIKETAQKAEKGKSIMPNIDAAIINNEDYSTSQKLWDTVLEASQSPFLQQFKSKTGQELETITPIAVFGFAGKLGGNITNRKLDLITKKSVGLGKDKNANRMILYMDKYDRELDIIKNKMTNEILDNTKYGLAPIGYDKMIEDKMRPYQKMVSDDIDLLLKDKKPKSPMAHKIMDGEDVTYKMRAPDGRVFNVPYKDIEQAINDELEYVGE